MEFSLDTVIYLLGLAFTWGSMMARLKALEKKMDMHNNAIGRITNTEKRLDVHDEKFKVVNHRLDDLEGG